MRARRQVSRRFGGARGAIRSFVASAVLASNIGFPVPARPDWVAPPENRGLQIALRTGAAVPLGKVSSTISMSDALGVEIPFILDIGAKPIPSLYIGGYLGAAVGGAAGTVATTCEQLGANCVGVGFRGGVMLQYSFKPMETINPWIGYGFGYEIGGSSGTVGATTISNSVRGFEYAHFIGGVDFRLQDVFGIGPYLDLSLAEYDYAQSQTNVGGYVTTLGGGVGDRAFHLWVIFGVRIVAFP